MFNAESASLILRSADLTANTTNAVGAADIYLTNFTWNNINLRTLLGSMYEKYDRFALVPTQIQSANGSAAFGSTADDRNCMIFISGMPFTNNTYNISTLTNQNYAFVNFLRFNTGATATQQSNGNIVLFSKNQELVNLNIFYQRINKNAGGNYNVVTTTTFPHMLFAFNIFGVSDNIEIPNINGSRLF
jgi:hypothetical protein